MTREYSSLTNDNVRRSLDTLIDLSSSPQDYQAAMFELGRELGAAIAIEIHDPDAKIYLACTAEDADFLAKEILASLEVKGFSPEIASE
jgi:hypothetical protein